jgi:hypothetical protein
MTARAWVTLGVRIVGFLFVLFGVIRVVQWLELLLLPAGPMASEMARNAMAMALVPAVAWIAFGLALAAASAGIARALFRGLTGGVAS